MTYQKREAHLLIEDLINKFSWAIGFRYAVVLLGFFLIYFSHSGNAYAPLSLELVVFVGLYNIVANLIYAFKKEYKLWQAAVAAGLFQFLDIAAVTFLIYITGWVESPYWFLYLVMIIVSGFGMFSYYSFAVFLIAFFSAVFYLGLLLSAYLGILPIYGTGFTLTPDQLLISIYNKAVFTSVAFFLFATTIYYFSKLLNEQREELFNKNRKVLIALTKIKAVDRMKDEFVSTASHELRTPLSVVRENLSLIEDGIVGAIGPKQKKLLETSRANIDRLAKILDNLLDISKIESHSLDLRCQTTDISQLGQKAVELLKQKAENRSIALKTIFPPGIMLWIDPEQVLRVFINLIDNAIKHTGKDGEIIVVIEDGKREVNVYVKDNGEGITKKDFPKVFERFVHIGTDRESLSKGAGLGLSICKGIVEMHNGKLWFESEVDKGSKFSFSLPKLKSDE